MTRSKGYRRERGSGGIQDLLDAKANGTRGTVDSRNKLTLQDDIPPWEHQSRAGESPRHYGLFAMYRDLGAATRTLDAVAQVANLSVARVRQVSAGNLWVSRVLAYDAEMDRLSRARLVEAREKTILLHLRVSEAIMRKGLQALEALDPETISSRDLAGFLAAGAEMARKALGMDSGQTSITVSAAAASATQGSESTIQVDVATIRDEVDAALGALASRLTDEQRNEALTTWMDPPRVAIEGEVVEATT